MILARGLPAFVRRKARAQPGSGPCAILSCTGKNVKKRTCAGCGNVLLLSVVQARDGLGYRHAEQIRIPFRFVPATCKARLCL